MTKSIIAATVAANLITVRTAESTSIAALSAITNPFCTLDTDIAGGAIEFITDTVCTFAALVADPAASGAFFTAV